MCVAPELDPNYKQILSDFEDKFQYLYDEEGLNMPLKIHVIVHHLEQYFSMTGITMKDTNVVTSCYQTDVW